MSTYYYRDGILYQTKTVCNLVETWQHECRVYPDEAKRNVLTTAMAGMERFDEYVESAIRGFKRMGRS